MFLDLHRNSFQTKVSQSLSQNGEKLFFSKKEFSKIHWEEKFREFELNGKLFDVFKIEKTKVGFEIYCVNDSEEENIVTIFKEWKNSNLPVSKAKIQLHPLFYSDSSIKIEHQYLTEQIASCTQTDNYISLKEQIPSPPPW
jgi:hypothetical protein